MSNFGIFLHKKFCTMLVLGCCAFSCIARAEDAYTVFSNDPKLNGYFEHTSDKAPLVKTLCSQGYYLSRCGTGVALGTNWLKGIKEISSGQTIETPDYYSYGRSASDVIHIANLRNFFAAKEPFTYVAEDGEHSVSPADYKNYKNQILSRVCTDSSGMLVGIECERCPENTFVAASTVQQHTDSNKLLWQTWDVHTIADCYATEFSDNTGTYKYVPGNIVADVNSSAVSCYYSVNVPGDNLRQDID